MRPGRQRPGVIASARLLSGQLSLARQQARGGNIPGALATWRSMFNGNTPPAGLAAEYYLN
ncbi:hypothetical protein QNH95_24795 [Klebsiella pneumoniae]|nr:hypothetical protein [Klebsiella pneumoniae]MDK9460930.1 hypothetical protein [Klebsiella pneumoniae]